MSVFEMFFSLLLIALPAALTCVVFTFCSTFSETEDPFFDADLDVGPISDAENEKLLQEWEDCKLQQLDELMPVISDC